MKALEAFVVEYDQTVRDSDGKIVDVVYGGDNCDASLLMKVDLKFLGWNLEKLLRRFPWAEEGEAMRALCVQAVEAKLSAIAPVLSTATYLPVNVPMLLEQRGRPPMAGAQFGSAAEAYAPLQEFLEFLHGQRNTLFLRTSVAFFLRTDVVLASFTREEFPPFLASLKRLYLKAKVEPGEMVGNLAAESVGQPATQLTLK